MIVFAGAAPLDSDVLRSNRYSAIAVGALARATLGDGPVLDGLALLPTNPASLIVTVAPGTITQLSVLDPIAYGSLLADSTTPLVKMGINLQSTSFSLTAPTIPGQSIAYLIQCSFLESDTDPVVLPYLNAADPSQPFSGPNNSGTPQNTTRIQRVQLQLKAGAPANTGTQSTPAADTGWVPIYVIVVSYGQTQITSTNLANARVAGAPFLGIKLPQAVGADSPSFINTPTAPTAPAGDSTTRLASTAFVQSTISTRTRTFLTADLDFYVATNGNDNNPGTAANIPFATLQAAWNAVVNKYDLSGHNVTIHVANGAYAAGVLCDSRPPGLGVANTVSFVGNPASPASVTISATNSNCFTASQACRILVNGFTLTATGTSGNYFSNGNGLLANASGNIFFQNVVFSSCTTAHMNASVGGYVSANGNGVTYSITGSSPNHVYASSSGLIAIAACAVTITGTPNFSSSFIYSQAGSEIDAWAMTFTGTATGPRYIGNILSSILTQGAGANYFPGNAVGSLFSGAQYV